MWQNVAAHRADSAREPRSVCVANSLIKHDTSDIDVTKAIIIPLLAQASYD